MDHSDYPKSLISRINEVYVFLDWLFGIRVENTVRITCVFNAFSTREVDKYKNVGSRVIR